MGSSGQCDAMWLGWIGRVHARQEDGRTDVASHPDGASAQSMMVTMVVMTGHVARDPAPASGATTTTTTATSRAWRRRRHCRSSWHATAAVATGHDEHVTP